jgi:hypothetical protein
MQELKRKSVALTLKQKMEILKHWKSVKIVLCKSFPYATSRFMQLAHPIPYILIQRMLHNGILLNDKILVTAMCLVITLYNLYLVFN